MRTSLTLKLIFARLYSGASYQRDSSKFYPGAGYQWDSSKFYSGAGCQWDSSKFYFGAGYQRDSSKFQPGTSYQRNFYFPRQFPAGISRKGSVRSRVLRFRLRDARLLAASRPGAPLRGLIGGALWQQLARRLRAEASQCARTRALFCFLPCGELCRV